jgi:hypothetical protein
MAMPDRSSDAAELLDLSMAKDTFMYRTHWPDGVPNRYLQ